jgi:phasin
MVGAAERLELTMSSNYEIPSEMRDFAEKSVDQARKAFDGIMGAAQKAASQADETAASAQSNVKAVGGKAISFAEENVRAAFDHAQRLVRARDIQEVLSLQSEYLRNQMTTIQEQAKQLGSTLQSAAQSTVQAATEGK